MVGEYLSNSVTDNEATLFQGIFRLPPAHYLTVRLHSCRTVRYWDVEHNAEIRYRSDDDYAAHFLELLREAVACRLRSHRPVSAYLTGGLDSSTVVSVSQALVQEGIYRGGDLQTFELDFRGSPDRDESAYVRDLAALWSFQSNVLKPIVADRSWYVNQVSHYRDFPDFPNGATSEPQMTLAAEKGVRAILTGFGGDDWFGNPLWRGVEGGRGSWIGPEFAGSGSTNRSRGDAIGRLL